MMTNPMTMIEKLIGADAGGRGLSTMLQPGDLEAAAKSLLMGNIIFIVTGFCIKSAMKGETDGPIGAVSLANSLVQLGKDIIFITDEYAFDLVSVCCNVLNLEVPIEVIPQTAAEETCRHLLQLYAPSHIVTVERPGRAADGRCYSMRGEDITQLVPNTDPLFLLAEEKGIVSIAVGDGGNEMGMGRIKDAIYALVANGEKIAAVTSAKYLIIAGVSNWGGHGIAAALSILATKQLLHDIEAEVKMLKEMVAVGAVDGCSKKRECTVDGLSLQNNLAILKGLREIVTNAIADSKEEVC